MEDRVHGGGEELGLTRGEGEGGDGVGVGTESVGNGVLREGIDVNVVVDSSYVDGLSVFGPFDLEAGQIAKTLASTPLPSSNTRVYGGETHRGNWIPQLSDLHLLLTLIIPNPHSPIITSTDY